MGWKTIRPRMCHDRSSDFVDNLVESYDVVSSRIWTFSTARTGSPSAKNFKCRRCNAILKMKNPFPGILKVILDHQMEMC